MNPHRWLAFLLLARLALGLVYSIAMPLGEAPDEADHLAYAVFIARERHLPEGAEMTQAKHPPLYHVLAAAVGGGVGLDTGFLRANPDVGFTADASPNFFVHTMLESWPWRDGPLAMHLARLVSVLAGVGLVAAVYALGRSVWPPRPNLAIAAAAFVAFLPESLFIGGAMSNDPLAALLATVGLWLGLRARKPWQAIVTGVVMGLGLWAKVSVAALWPVICLALLVQGWKGAAGQATGGWRRIFRPRVWGPAASAGLAALVVTAPWFLRNRQLYGDWMGWPLVLATIDRRTGPFGPAELLWLLRGLFVSFWGKFGGAGHIALPWPFYALWAGLVGASAAGWLWRVGEAAKRRSSESANQRISEAANQRSDNLQSAICSLQSAIVLLGAPFMIFVWLIAYSRVALGTDQGRLLFPAIGPLVLLLVGGLAAVRRQGSIGNRQSATGNRQPATGNRQPATVGGQSSTAALAGWSALMLAVAIGALVFGLWLPFAPPPAPPAGEAAAARSVGRLLGNEIELVSYRWEDEVGQAGERQLILYWRATRPIAADLRTALRLVDAQGGMIWEWKRSPGAGRFSTDHWPVGRVVADIYRIPADRLAQVARIEIGVRPFPEGAWLAVDGQPASPFLTVPIEERDS